jgi:septal ring factor EnvC (AmiA/AmiB activator)
MRVTMPNMTDDNPPGSGVLDPDDFDRAASRGFVRYELAVTRSELKQDIAHVRLEIAETKRELKQDIANLRTELKHDIAEVRLEIAEVKRELKQDIADIRHEIATLRTDMIERFNALDRSMWWKLSVAVVAASALAELFGRL